jgi:hypothetical protein
VGVGREALPPPMMGGVGGGKLTVGKATGAPGSTAGSVVEGRQLANIRMPRMMYNTFFLMMFRLS